VIVIALTDIHGSHTAIERITDELESADVVVLAGDLTNFGHKRDAQRIIRIVTQHARQVLAVPGNCDYPDVLETMDELGVGIHGSHTVIDGISFVGLGGSLPAPGSTPFEFAEDELRTLLDRAVIDLPDGAPTILVSHQPPFGTLSDRIYSGEHVGSTAVRSFIEAHQPMLCLTGHIHEAAGITSLGRTQIVNPGPFGRRGYAYAVIGQVVEQLEIRHWIP
jgi:Icc-related predicted phosphoesterase